MGRYDNIKLFDGANWLVPKRLKVFNGTDWVDFGEADSYNKIHLKIYNGIRMRRITLERKDIILNDDPRKYIINAATGEKIYKYEEDRMTDLLAPKASKYI